MTPAERLRGEWVPGTDLYEFKDGFPIRIGDWTVDHVPPGYRTNFTSAPRLLWRIVHPTDKHLRRASGGHDRQYDIGRPKLVADAIWACVAREDGAPVWKWLGGFALLALFGWGNYNKCQDKKGTGN